MADYFQSLPSFVNPQYATPEQLANQRAYADALMKRSGENVNRPAGALANMIEALTSGLVRNNANETQQRGAEANTNFYKNIAERLQNGLKPNPADEAGLAGSPLTSPEGRAMAQHLMRPEGIKDEYGNPAFISPNAGVQPAPIQGRPGNFQPAYRVHQAAEGVSTDAPFPAPGGPRGPAPIDAVNPQGGNTGGLGYRNVGPAPSPQPAGVGGGGAAPGGAALPAASPAPAGGPLTLDGLAAYGRDIAARRGVNEAQTNLQKQDLEAATSAPVIKRIAGTMMDDVRMHGDKMTFGPTAEWSNTIKRAAANYAPGIMKDQLEALASADSFDKMSAQLTSMLAKGGGTDAQLFNNMKSVPGAHNSKEGAIALLSMVNQVADQQMALRAATAGKFGDAYEMARNQFFANPQNRLVNPITGNPIAQDLQKKESTDNGGFKVLKVH